MARGREGASVDYGSCHLGPVRATLVADPFDSPKTMKHTVRDVILSSFDLLRLITEH